MSFEIQELPDIIRVIVLLSLSKGTMLEKSLLKRRIDKVCAGYACIEMSDLDEALKEVASEGLILDHDGTIQLTEQGIRLGREWQGLLLKKEPVLEVVTGVADGSITGLVVILSAFIGGLAISTSHSQPF